MYPRGGNSIAVQTGQHTLVVAKKDLCTQTYLDPRHSSLWLAGKSLQKNFVHNFRQVRHLKVKYHITHCKLNHTPLTSVFDLGDTICNPTLAAPTPSPTNVIRSGSPWKARMFVLTNSKANSWSNIPQFPLQCSSSVDKNPKTEW